MWPAAILRLILLYHKHLSIKELAERFQVAGLFIKGIRATAPVRILSYAIGRSLFSYCCGNSICHSRRSGNPAFSLWTPASAGVTSLVFAFRNRNYLVENDFLHRDTTLYWITLFLLQYSGTSGDYLMIIAFTRAQIKKYFCRFLEKSIEKTCSCREADLEKAPALYRVD